MKDVFAIHPKVFGNEKGIKPAFFIYHMYGKEIDAIFLMPFVIIKPINSEVVFFRASADE